MYRRQGFADHRGTWTSMLSQGVLSGFCLSSVFFWSCFPQAASHGQLFTWTGGGATNNWSEAANWGGVVPSSGSSLFFPSNANPFPFNNLGTFDLDLLFLSAPTYIISGNPLRFSATTPELTAQSGSAHVINNDVIIAQPLEVQVNSGINLFLDGDLSGAGDITKIQEGLLVLGGSNGAWSGDLDIQAGTVRFDPGDALSNNTLINVAFGATADFSPEGEQFGGFTGSGHIELGDTVDFIPRFNTDQNFFGTVNGTSADFQKLGAATLFLVNNSSIVVDRLSLDAGRIEFSIGNMTVTGGTDVAAGTELEIISGSFNPGALSTVAGTMTVTQGAALSPSAGSSILVNGTGELSVTDGQISFQDALVSITDTDFNTGGGSDVTRLSNGVTVRLQGDAISLNFGQMNASDDVEVIGGALLDVRVGGVASIPGALHVGTGSDGSVFADGDFFGPSSANGMIIANQGTSHWGENGGAAELTFQDGADGFFADVDMARSTTPNTTASLTLLSGGDVFVSSLQMADLGGTTTSAQIFVGENSDLTVLGPLATIGHSTEGSATIEITGIGSEADFSGATTTVHATGSVHISDDGEFIISDDFSLLGGTLEVNTGGLFTANNGAFVLNLDGTISGGGQFMFAGMAGLLQNAGTVSPGDEQNGTLTIIGNYGQSSDGTLEIEIGGLTPGTDHDVLFSTKAATLDGTLDVLAVDFDTSYTASAGDRFTIIQSLSPINGTFSTVDLPNVLGGRFVTWLPVDYVTDPNAVSLEIASVSFFDADFDEDGDVDKDDLVKWEAGYGASSGAAHLDGDADGDMDVDGDDFLLWQRQVGLGVLPVVAAATAVPEPASLLLSWALITQLFTKRRTTSNRCRRR